MEDQPANLFALPQDVLTHTVSFLDYSSALKLSCVNSRFHSILSLSAIHEPEPFLREKSWFGDSREMRNTPHRLTLIPVLFPNRTHSVVLTCQWEYQSWGNRTGALFVVAAPANSDLSSSENGQIVYESPVAPHEQASLRMSFNYSPSKAYYMWYRLGVGHRLVIKNLTVHAVIYDHPNRLLLSNYDALKSQNGLPIKSAFYLNLLLASASSVLAQLENGQNADSHLAFLFDSSCIQVTATSMKAMVELAMALINRQIEETAHSMWPTDIGDIDEPFESSIEAETDWQSDIEAETDSLSDISTIPWPMEFDTESGTESVEGEHESPYSSEEENVLYILRQ